MSSGMSTESTNGLGSGPAGEAQRPVEPDYRFTLANERTFLACIRTAIAMLAGGLAADQLVANEGRWQARTVLSLGLISLALVTAVASYGRYVRADTAIRNDEPLPAWRLGLVVSVGISLACAFAVVVVLTSGH